MNGSDASYQLFVADSGTHWLGPCYLSAGTPADLRVEQGRDRILDDFVFPFVGTGVDALVFRVDAGNQFLCYDTEAGEPVTGIQPRLEREYGLTPRPAGGGEYVSFLHALGWWRLAENFKLFKAHGFDPWAAIIEAAHQKGFQVFLELQINQSDAAIHHLDGSGLPASRFLLEHPEYLLGYECHRTDLNPGAEAYRGIYHAPAPDGDTHSRPETAFCARLDFGREEVRRYRLAVVEELCARYELDGLQINLCADPHFFKRDEVDTGRELMTRFAADLKAATRRIGENRGRPIRLLYRFFAHQGLEMLRDQVGLDVARWIREGSADLVAPVGSIAANEHVAAVEECVRAARGADCQVLGCISEIMSDQFTQIRPSTEMLQAANLLYRQAGASGLHVWWPRQQSAGRDFQRPQDFSLLRELKSAAACARCDKHYLLCDQLPLSIEEGREYALHLRVADDLQAAAGSGRLEEVVLVIGLRHFTQEDQVRFFLNGEEISRQDFVEPDYPAIWYRVGRLEALLTRFEVKQGMNEFRVKVERHVPDPDGMTLPPDDPRRPDVLALTNLELIVVHHSRD